MAWIDWCIAAVVLMTAINAGRKGFVVEAFSLAGIVLGLLLASWNYRRAVPYFSGWLHPGPLAEAAAFLAIALGVMILAGLIGRAIRWSARSLGLGWADRLLGVCFGLVKGGILVTLAVMALAAFWPKAPWLRGSELAPYFLSAARDTAFVTPLALGERVRHGIRLLHEQEEGWLHTEP
ncbi:MAG TPA: CvpA family protein [Acidobacteriaceae bacterium]